MTNVARTTASSSTVFESEKETPAKDPVASSQDAVRLSAPADRTLGPLSQIERLPFELKAEIFKSLDPVSAWTLGSSSVSMNQAYRKAVEFKYVDDIDSVRQRHIALRQKIDQLRDKQSMESFEPLLNEAASLLSMAFKPRQATRLCSGLFSRLLMKADSIEDRLAVLSKCADIFGRMPDPAAAQPALGEGVRILLEMAVKFDPAVSVLSAPFAVFFDAARKCIGASCRANAVGGWQMSVGTSQLLGKLFEHTPKHQQSELALRLMRPCPDGIVPPLPSDPSVDSTVHPKQFDVATTLGLLEAMSGGMRMGGCSIEVMQRLCDLCRQSPRFENFAFNFGNSADSKLRRLVQRLPAEEQAAGEALHGRLQDDIKRRLDIERKANRLQETAS